MGKFVSMKRQKKSKKSKMHYELSWKIKSRKMKYKIANKTKTTKINLITMKQFSNYSKLQHVFPLNTHADYLYRCICRRLRCIPPPHATGRGFPQIAGSQCVCDCMRLPFCKCPHFCLCV